MVVEKMVQNAVAPEPDGKFDPITAEVIRSSFENIVQEMSLVLLRTSGSPILTETKDFSTILFDADCNQIGVVGYLLYHLATSRLAVRAIAEARVPHDIHPGDAFICNDPHNMGAAHQGDVGIVMPIFYGEKLVGWCFANAHMADIGGSAISGFAPEAKDVFSEALRFPGTRIVRNGVLDTEWVRFISNNVRVPVSLISDLRSLIAACNSGGERYRDLIDEYGYDRLKAYSDYNMDLSEQAMRTRIRQLPEGTFQTYDWVEYDGSGTNDLYPMFCEMEVRDGDLKFTFSGGPQVPAFVNAAQGGLEGNVISLLSCQLIHDVPLNEGIWRCVEIDRGPVGSITNPVVPAPVTAAHATGGSRICRMVQDAVVTACSLSESEEVRGRVSGIAPNLLAVSIWFGQDKNGDPSVFLPLDSGTGVGGAAQSFGDGQDNYGLQATLSLTWADVEVYELGDPVLLLWRKIKANSGGAGRYRGGLGMDAAFMVRYGESFVGQTFMTGGEVPGKGFAGGYPGSGCAQKIVHDSNAYELLKSGKLPSSAELITGTADGTMRANATNLHMGDGDVYWAVSSGGGGMGDPFLRPIAEIQADLEDGRVTAAAAEELYGAVVKYDDSGAPKAIDEAATWARRDTLREAIVPGKVGSLADISAGSGAEGVLLKGGEMVCAHCATGLCGSHDQWKAEVPTRRRDLCDMFEAADTVFRRRADNPVEIIEYFCPHCASVLAVDLVVEGLDREPPIFRLKNAAAE